MKIFVPIAIAAAMLSSIPDILGPISRRSNSEASSQRGREAFVEGRYEDAAKEFGNAAEHRPGPDASFNLGTAQIAAGDVAAGLQSLAGAFESDSLSTDVRYNAGWAALEVGDLDNAIRAYQEVLRERPGDGNAKRNLEIALRKKHEQEQNQQQSGQPNPQQQPQPEEPDEDERDDGDQPPPEAQQPRQDSSDVESILRSVEQQEKEELDRMRRSRRGRKADW